MAPVDPSGPALAAFLAPDAWHDLLDRLWAYIEMGGWVMPPLLVCLVLLWWAIGYRLSALRRSAREDVRVQLDAYRKGAWQEPRDLVQQAIVRGWALRHSGRPHLRRLLDEAFGDLGGELRRYVVLIGTIVSVAPLLGLLGTVTGMIETFDSLRDQVLFSRTGGVAAGISQALLTTQLGLAVAVPGLIIQGFLARRTRRMEQELDQIKDLLVSMPPEPLPPQEARL